MSTQLYARVFTQILDSSLAEDWQTRHVFEDLLKLADGGVVDMTRQAIVRRTNIPAEVVDAAIAKLEAPDPASRDAAEDGRRLVRLDDHRDWGWLIVNWEKYEQIKTSVDQRIKTAERMRRYRERKKVSPAPLLKGASDTASEAEAEGSSPNVTQRNAPLHGVTSRTNGATKRTAGAVPASCSEADWLAGLKADPAYEGIDVDREHARMLRWCTENQKGPTRKRFVNWLNRADRPLTTTPSKSTVSKGHVTANVTGEL